MNPASEAHSAWRIFRAPLAIAVATAVGLLAALVGDGALDVLSWLTLALPPAAVAWKLAPRRVGRLSRLNQRRT